MKSASLRSDQSYIYINDRRRCKTVPNFFT